ncbi:MAG: hypothetical protein U0T36_03295 [Saprospiraceae bacterium]
MKLNPTADISTLDVKGLAPGNYSLTINDVSGKAVVAQSILVEIALYIN